jgi:hypothetical protein
MCQKRHIEVTKETYSSAAVESQQKGILGGAVHYIIFEPQCQKRPIDVSKET